MKDFTLKDFAILVGLCAVAGLVFGLGSHWFPWTSGGSLIAAVVVSYFVYFVMRRGGE